MVYSLIGRAVCIKQTGIGSNPFIPLKIKYKIMTKLHEYIRNMLVFFHSKFLIENNEVKANGVLTLISQWDKLIDRIDNLDASAPKIAALIKAEFHTVILQIKRNKNIFISNDKRLILSLVKLLQTIRTKDIKSLLFSDLNDVRHLGKIFTDKRIISVHYPKGHKSKKNEESKVSEKKVA